MNSIRYSEKIKLIIELLEECKKDNKWYENQLKDCEKRENNALHDMEGLTEVNQKTPPKVKEIADCETRKHKGYQRSRAS